MLGADNPGRFSAKRVLRGDSGSECTAGHRTGLFEHASVTDSGDRPWSAHLRSRLHRLIHDRLAERVLHDGVCRRID